MNTTKKPQYLFLIDLDGTVLSNSMTKKIHPKTIEEIKKLTKAGHKVCIATGRPWRSVQDIYKKLELKTVVSNHNGAHIHHPMKNNFISRVRYIDLHILMYILSNKYLKSVTRNVAIQGITWVQMAKRDKLLAQIFGFNTMTKFRIGIDLGKIPMKPIGAIIDLKDNVDVIKLGNYLKRRYSDLANFSHWPKGKNLSPVFEISPLGAKKNVTLSYLARYYHIKNKHTIAIGDGWNDINMFKVAGVSVAMKNSLDYVKEHATFTTDLTNSEGGVGDFIEKFLKDPNKYIEKAKESKEFFIKKKKKSYSGAYH